MNIQFNVEARDDKNEFIWCHGIFAPNVSKGFMDELNSILSLSGSNNVDRVLNTGGSASKVKNERPRSKKGNVANG